MLSRVRRVPLETIEGTQSLPDDWFDRFLFSCSWLAHDFAAALCATNRRETCAKVRQANNELASKALTQIIQEGTTDHADVTESSGS